MNCVFETRSWKSKNINLYLYPTLSLPCGILVLMPLSKVQPPGSRKDVTDGRGER